MMCRDQNYLESVCHIEVSVQKELQTQLCKLCTCYQVTVWSIERQDWKTNKPHKKVQTVSSLT